MIERLFPARLGSGFRWRVPEALRGRVSSVNSLDVYGGLGGRRVTSTDPRFWGHASHRHVPLSPGPR